MKVTPALKEELADWLDNYWTTYIKGDIETWATFIRDDYRNIGGTKEEIWNSKQEIINYTNSILSQMIGSIDIRNRKVELIPYGEYMMVHEFTDLFVKVEGEWIFYGPFRMSSLLEKTDTGWIALHQHGSYPDMKAMEGEAFSIDALKAENAKLQAAVKSRTIELEIEAALERVRAEAMGMKKPDDILAICKIMFRELQLLGFRELRNTIINFWDDEHSSLIDYDYSDETGGNKAILTYSSHPVFEEFQRTIKNSEDAFAELVVTKEELESWKQRRRDSGEYEDTRLNNIDALYYYFYSIGVGAIGISTFSSISEDQLNTLKRFRNVFDFAYRRYTDVTQAEAQAKEALIELGLERVRARAMAMQHSGELAELVTVVFKELTQLDFSLTSCIIWINDVQALTNTLWVTSAEMNKPAEPVCLKPFQHEFFHSIIHAWKEKDPKWIYTLTGNEKFSFEKAFFAEVPNMPVALKKALSVPKEVVFSASFNNFGALEILGTEALTDEKFSILHRFGKVGVMHDLETGQR
ncbi:MAG TPA: nuclear transport factor 2 family protein, partial [Lacibacter sp.]|nr:nuclear transport factor 2 family protein [Lacibacter sp.]